ncbi:AraC family transcriptional regulator [Pseudorhodoferax sp.]|uniref:AraC family transcriptional regulator n=1 Tax=Pseudorhodoferax sp. TaxID=1993553 RepID=UPI002DD67475|nr:AraC family transcriptional regulator [Pseudorhodoferax sp.]
MNVLGHGTQKFPHAQLTCSSRGLGWQGIAAELRSHPAGDLPPFQPDQLEITIALATERGAVVSRKGAGQRQQTRVDAGTIWISPVGVSEDDIRITRPLSRILHLYLPAQPFDTLSDTLGGGRFGADAVRYLAGVQDELIRQMGHALLSEMTAPSAGGRLLAESLGAALTARLVQAHSSHRGAAVAVATPRQALDTTRTQRVIDFMRANLGEDIGLDALAAVACLSPFHFSRMFHKRVGLPPHRYLAQLRMEAARSMLCEPHRSLADIAEACRFSSQSNFTRAFRQATGMTPGAFRKTAGADAAKEAAAAPQFGKA